MGGKLCDESAGVFQKIHKQAHTQIKIKIKIKYKGAYKVKIKIVTTSILKCLDAEILIQGLFK